MSKLDKYEAFLDEFKKVNKSFKHCFKNLTFMIIVITSEKLLLTILSAKFFISFSCILSAASNI
jgi:hypothetical protein